MLEDLSLLVIVIPLLLLIILPGILLLSLGTKIWYGIRKKNMQKLAEEYGLQFRANTPGFKQCLDELVWPYALREDWKTNFMEGVIGGHKIFICDNLYSGPRVFGKPLNSGNRRTIVQIDGQDMKGKEMITQLGKFQDGGLTSVGELKNILSQKI